MTPERIRMRFAWLAAVALFVASPLSARAESSSDTPEGPPSKAAEETLQSEVHEEYVQRQEAILAEARTALDETHAALSALENDDAKEALAALARATGTLEILLAREPDLALAPIDVDVSSHDLYATVEDVRAARKQASDLLDDGRIQEARSLLSGLASEIVISVTNLPLATYPDAIKAVSPLIDQGKLEEARLALRTVLNTLVVTNRVISLPVVRASHMLDEAESLIAKPAGSEEGEETVEVPSEKITELVKGARGQLEMAEALGYGRKSDYEQFRKQIAELEKKIGTEQSTEGIFAKLHRSLERFETSFFQ